MINYSYYAIDKDSTELIISPLAMNVWEKIIERNDNELTAHLFWLLSNCSADNKELCNLLVESNLFLKTILPILESNVVFNNVLSKGLKLISLIVKNDNEYALQYRLISIIVNSYINNKSFPRNECLSALAHSSVIPSELVHMIITEIIKERKVDLVYRILNVILYSSQLIDAKLINVIITYLCESIRKPLHSNEIHKDALFVLAAYFEKDNATIIKKVISDGVFLNIIMIAKEEKLPLAKEALNCIYSALCSKDFEVALMILQFDICDLCIQLLHRRDEDNEFNESILDVINLYFELGAEGIKDNKDNYCIALFKTKGGIELISQYLCHESDAISQKATYLLTHYSHVDIPYKDT